MTRLQLFLSGSALAALVAIGVVHVTHAEQIPLTEGHQAFIATTCVDAQKTLSQLNTSDTLLRVNSGQKYESVATKLMAPMNSRIALNRFDGNELLSTTATYERQIDEFRRAYREYGDALTRALKDSCKDNPEQFYYHVDDARTKRANVHAKIITLNQSLKTYRQQFEQFASGLDAQKSGGQ